MKSIVYLLRVLVLFLIAFGVSRSIFVCYLYPQLGQESWKSILSCFYFALKIDVAASCYLLLLPLLLIILETVFEFSFFAKLRRAHVFLILFINALFTSADQGLYQEWGVKMNYRALQYLVHPSEVVFTATNQQLITFVLLIILQMTVCSYIYFKWLKPYDQWIAGSKFVNVFISLLLVPVLVLGIRGGSQQVPIQVSDVYYSTNPNLNWAAVNTLWNVAQSVATGMKYGLQNPYPFYDKSEAGKVVKDLYSAREDSTVLFLKDQQSNIVFIVFEGWSADLIESISHNKERACTPHFDKLAAEGILFTNCIASGERSDQGLAAILSSFPSLPLSSVVNYPEKVDQLPALLKPFKDKGYRSLFLFGGQLSYGNLKALIYHNGFDKVIEEKDIDPKIHRGRLGVHDEFTFDIFQHEISPLKPPFFAGIFTQSTHFSYDYPKAKKPLDWAGAESDYANSMMYADSCLGNFFDKAKKQSWFANTLFVMVSDHSHVMPWNDDHKKSALHHIPLLFFGDVIKKEYRGSKKEAIVSQQDICATLLAQMKLPHQDFKWSKDMMNAGANSFAYWTFTEGFGFSRNDGCEFIYDLANKKDISQPVSKCDSTDIKHEGFSYLQMVFEDFISSGKKAQEK